MRYLTVLPLALALIGCPKSTADTTGFDRSVQPEPLERQPFQLPPSKSTTLSNGLRVMVVENHELPLVSVRLIFSSGSFTDPVGKEGLAKSTMDLLNEGAGDLDAGALSTALRRLATHLTTSSGLDSASVRMECMKKQLEPSLDLFSTVLLEPTFPETEWHRLRKQYLQDLVEARTTPTRIAGRVFDRVLFGNSYDGRLQSHESVSALTVADMQEWYRTHATPGNAIVLVGGDTTVEEMSTLLESRLGTWTGDETPQQGPEIETSQPEQTMLYVVDKPGAAQSVIYAGRFVGTRADDHYDALRVGNTVFGGMFMARINMNLREDKGYTYGARSQLASSLGPTLWWLSTSVKTDTTADAVSEIFRELTDIQGERPLTPDEVGYFKSSLIRGFPSKFETANYLLSQKAEVWRYDLPEDWLDTWIDRVDRVTPDAAQRALSDHVATQPLAMVVVGDLATIREGLEALDQPMTELDVDGNPLP